VYLNQGTWTITTLLLSRNFQRNTCQKTYESLLSQAAIVFDTRYSVNKNPFNTYLVPFTFHRDGNLNLNVKFSGQTITTFLKKLERLDKEVEFFKKFLGFRGPIPSRSHGSDTGLQNRLF
jgi:hypothetical protein